MSYADAWLKWFDVIEEGASALSARMIALAGLDRATSVLDIGTGIGEPALSAARLLPAGGRVTALDSDPAMIDLARARAAKAGVRNIDFHVGRVESADLPEAGFDVILARWSLMFVGDLPATLGKLAAALRPGGRLVAGLWCNGAGVPALTLAESAVFEHFGWPPEERAVRKAFSMSDEARTVALFEHTGYRDVSTDHCEVV